MTLPAFAAERRAAAPLLLGTGARRFLLLAPSARHSAANPPHAAAAVDRWDRQTDARPFRRPCSADYAGSVDNIR